MELAGSIMQPVSADKVRTSIAAKTITPFFILVHLSFPFSGINVPLTEGFVSTLAG
jgi:hypothetical protein